VSRARFCGAGKGAPFAAEEFRFDEILGKRCTIKPDERLVRATAQGDDRACGELFAGAAFAPDQNVDIARGDLLNSVVDQPHRLACADEVLKPAGLERLLARPFPFDIFAAPADVFEKSHSQLGHIHRTAEVSVGSSAQRLLFDGASTGAAHGDQSEIGIEPTELSEKRKSPERVLSLGIDVEQHGGYLSLSRPSGEILVSVANHDLDPGQEFGPENLEKFFVERDDANRGERRSCGCLRGKLNIVRRGHTAFYIGSLRLSSTVFHAESVENSVRVEHSSIDLRAPRYHRNCTRVYRHLVTGVLGAKPDSCFQPSTKDETYTLCLGDTRWNLCSICRNS
jgi:hypothetical protein